MEGGEVSSKAAPGEVGLGSSGCTVWAQTDPRQSCSARQHLPEGRPRAQLWTDVAARPESEPGNSDVKPSPGAAFIY